MRDWIQGVARSETELTQLADFDQALTVRGNESIQNIIYLPYLLPT